MSKKRCLGLQSKGISEDDDGKTDTFKVEFLRLNGKPLKRKSLSTSDAKLIFSQTLELQENLFKSNI